MKQEDIFENISEDDEMSLAKFLVSFFPIVLGCAGLIWGLN